MSFPLLEKLLLFFSSPVDAMLTSHQINTSTNPLGTTVMECNQPGMVALAYDDGPGPYTEELLGILKDNRVNATFFVNGNNVNGPITNPNNAQILQKAYASGHHVGSHTWSHKDLSLLSRDQRMDEMFRLDSALEDIIGYTPRYMRPPFFSCTEDCQRDMAGWGYHIVTANLDTKDYEEDYAQSRNTFSSALNSSSPKNSSFIVLVHDTHEGTVEAFTKYMIDEARGYGYKLVTLGECLGDSSVH
ncbi:hypothetical protein BKA67DRAFT_665751 [Truncatella angustata]|uniref:NodB homology domain-containing protein n=1 Tax=Truncatella angustata TaxID=152316 RepID=A0A9P8UUU2_9PEZI|nr:uncharacterized protein BKA67DRAFT_665751 [Truncatella angustata]KAH6658916.1 hypothetical protein BKA67DRAFT_665751 [Truncatella angustata]